MRSAHIIAKCSGSNKNINKRFYKNHTALLIYIGRIPIRMIVVNTNGTLFQTDEIIYIHTVKGNGDVIVETLKEVYIISVDINLQYAPDHILKSTVTSCDSIHIPLLSIDTESEDAGQHLRV